MLRLPTDTLQPGMILAKPVTDEQGRVLLRQDIPLTLDYIATLKRRGVSNVYIRDSDTDDIVIEEVLSDELRHQTQASLTRVFNFVQDIADTLAEGKEMPATGPHDQAVAGALRSHESFKQLERLVTSVVDNLIESETLISIAQIRNSNDILFRHSVSVAVTALLIGKRLNLGRMDLEQLGMGCMLHDIGKIFLKPALGQSGGEPVTAAQSYRLLCEHPRMGYELLHARNPDAVLVNRVALQHHERQDGRGYPAGLRGTNRFERFSRVDEDHISLVAEIAAVADVYDLLSSGDDHRPALTPWQVADTLRRLAGTFLNKEITVYFLSMLPILPVGMGVIVRTGRYAGSRGLVIQANKGVAERPVVRLLYDAQGERMTPVELDLARESSLLVEATLA